MKKRTKIFFTILLFIAILFLCFMSIFFGYIITKSYSLKLDKDKISSAISQVRFYDNRNDNINGELINNENIKLSELNQYTIDAFLCIEDKEFYNHDGLNYKRIVGAMFTNLKEMSFVQGASTISQQLIKNTHLTNEKTISRKINEMILTKKLENEFTKNEILETYLNVIYFGEGCYGIESASKNYFNISASDLTLSQSAILAGIIKSPARYSPIYNFENCLKRRNLVLSEMLKDNKISIDEYNTALFEVITIEKNNYKSYVKNYYDYAINEACDILNLLESEILNGKYKIYTYLDLKKQEDLCNIINDEHNYEKNKYGNTPDGMGIIIDNKTNGVVAFAQNSDYNLIKLNRQPGSTIKPILVYAPALEQGLISPITQILDEETDFDGYVPHNVGGFHGYISVRDSIAKSLNVPAVKVLQESGIEYSKKFAEKSGIKFNKNDNGLAIALGGFTDGITLKDLTNSFTTFANLGYYKDAKFIKRIETKDGLVLFDNESKKALKVMSDDTAYLMTDMLISGVENGTSKKLDSLNYQVAGKTGTVAVKGTNYNTDAISVAYTTDYTIGSWLGNYTLKDEFNLSSSNNGGTFATQILKDTFNSIYKDYKPDNFKKPDSIVELEIDSLTLENEHKILIATDDYPERYKLKEIFSTKYLPSEKSKTFVNLKVENFEAKNNKDLSNTITFEAKKHLKYQIVCIHKNNEIILDTIENKEQKIEFTHFNLKSDEKYIYYIKIYNIYNSIRKNSEKITVYTPEVNYDNILTDIQNKQDNKNYSWYFY